MKIDIMIQIKTNSQNQKRGFKPVFLLLRKTDFAGQEARRRFKFQDKGFISIFKKFEIYDDKIIPICVIGQGKTEDSCDLRIRVKAKGKERIYDFDAKFFSENGYVTFYKDLKLEL